MTKAVHPSWMYDAQLQALDERQVEGRSVSIRYHRPDWWLDNGRCGAGIWFWLSNECVEGMVGEGDITI